MKRCGEGGMKAGRRREDGGKMARGRAEGFGAKAQ